VELPAIEGIVCVARPQHEWWRRTYSTSIPPIITIRISADLSGVVTGFTQQMDT
jgi:hypothetical protein